MAPIFSTVFTLFLAASTAFAAPAPEAENNLERRMTYRDNQVVFRNLNARAANAITDLSYSIRDLSVTGGQDPEGRNRRNDFKTSFTKSNSERIFNFSVGRKKSGEVASWWSNNIGKGQNTFNDRPKELNFAFIGDLKLDVPDSRGRIITIIFNGIAMAQGNTGSANNWWFGGKSCTAIGGDQVRCSGFDGMNRRRVEVVFRRGNSQGSDVNRVDIMDVYY